ncbi:MAG: transcription antitermination factor NusB [Lachnospiraceae bacterium]|nr:transcription antitermination factor NusB [Lachnospiraceae bacterium]
MSRRKIREHLFKLVFIFSFTREKDMEEQVRLYLDGIENLDEQDRKTIEERFRAVCGRVPEIDARLNATAKGWKTDRFGSADLAIMRVAVYEMLFDEKIPEGVAINEAVELAKLYGGDESPAFINGILGKISAESKENKE